MTTPNTEQETIIRRIQKLFAMAQGNHSQAEAEAMMAKAQQLLAAHNLDSAMVMEARVAGGTVAAAPEKREKTRMNRSAQYQWQRDMWKAIAEANFCWHSVIEVYAAKREARTLTNEDGSRKTSRKPVKRHLILGKESNVIAVQLMGEYLEDTMERLLPYPNHERLSRAAINWKAGCAERLSERVRQQAEERKQESDAGAAATADSGAPGLVLRDVYTKEYALNYDVRFGEGAYARKLITDSEWEAGREERERKRREEAEEEERKWLEYLQNESSAQKKAREREEAKDRLKQARATDRMFRRFDTENRKEAQKYDGEARRAGYRVGDSIGLSSQVGNSTITRKDRMAK